jgi:DNA helicase-2/ATP-dependent DNA helicase PcrA
MSEDLALSLSEFSGKGYVIAPAGYGKTHLIAEAVKKSKERQLILTHTYAGVDSIKNKMKALGVSSSLYKIETIASWSLKMCLSYPKSSGWKKEYPTGKEWGELYAACTFLLAKSFAERVLRSSYIRRQLPWPFRVN